MMTTLQSKEYGKGPKENFAPPAQKLHSLMHYSPNSPKEETLEINFPEAEARPNLLKDRLEKTKKKAPAENGPGSGQGKKVKAQDNKQAKKEEVKSYLTSEEFEEIVQLVLRKSFQQSLETSCAQPVRYTQLDKEPGTVSSTTDDNADGEKIVVPHILETSTSQEYGVIPEIKASKPGQPDPAPSEKKFSRSFLSKRKKEAQDKKVKKAQGGHEYRQKDQPKKMVQGHSQIMDQHKGEESGFEQCLVWVQCSFPNCEKWRQLRGNIDPSVLPDNWSCDQNTDLQYNRCDIPEENWTGRESDVAYASYIPGSIIWAKQYGYPWWPGMVESDPDLGEYFLFASHLDSLPCKYHVTFFGEIASRAWVPVNMLKNFQELSLELAGVKQYRNKDCSHKLGAALIMAQEAEQISIQERVNLFGFQSRFNGSDNSGKRKDLMLSGANCPDSSLEKEEEESELEEEEEKEKDPTLPIPKPAKVQTRNSKATGFRGDAGIAAGQDGTLQRNTMKRSLVNEPAAAPVPRMGRKEVHANSNSDQPAAKKIFKAPQIKFSVTSLSEEKAVRMVPKGLIPSAHHGSCPAVGIEEPAPQEPPPQKAGNVPPDDEASSDLDLEQLMEDFGKELEQHSDADAAFFEE